MKNKSATPIKQNLEEIYLLAKEGISKDDKQFLLDEIEGMITTLENWKEHNPSIPKRKAS